MTAFSPTLPPGTLFLAHLWHKALKKWVSSVLVTDGVIGGLRPWRAPPVLELYDSMPEKSLFPMYSVGTHLKAPWGRVALSLVLTLCFQLEFSSTPKLLQNFPKPCCRRKEKANYLQLAQRSPQNSKRSFRQFWEKKKQCLWEKTENTDTKKSVLRCHIIFGKLLVSVWKLPEVWQCPTDVHIWQCSVSSTCWHTCVSSAHFQGIKAVEKWSSSILTW